MNHLNCSFIFLYFSNKFVSPQQNQIEKGNLVLIIKDLSQNYSLNSMGQTQIQLNQIQSTEPYRSWIDLFDESGRKKKGKILVELQWTFTSVNLKE